MVSRSHTDPIKISINGLACMTGKMTGKPPKFGLLGVFKDEGRKPLAPPSQIDAGPRKSEGGVRWQIYT